MVMLSGTASLLGQVPSGLIDKKRCVPSGCDVGRDRRHMQAHRLGVAPGQDQADALALLGADSAEDVGRRRALVLRGRWPGAALRPASRDLVLLTDARFIAEPDLYIARIDALLARDLVEKGGEVFLKASMAPSACA